ncbi:DUF3159 domain-containing protein [Kribbella sp. NPDC051952]|uniref:DUF3159 domain-containing protein n=1 Tax=Kribbella sp. NPDC051952 TaxID=3154851 RepID=UPI003437E5C0
MSRPAAETRSQYDVRLPDAVRTAWRSLRRSGLVAPELPPILFIAVANSTGFWWGLGAGIMVLGCVVVMARRQGWPKSTVIGGAVGLTIAATIAHVTGVAASGLVADICLDLTLGGILVGSVAVRRPLFAVLWNLVRRQPPRRSVDPNARAVYNLTTLTAGVALVIRAVALGIVYLNEEPVAWLLIVRVALGLPVTLVVIAAAYAAGGIQPKHPEPDEG